MLGDKSLQYDLAFFWPVNFLLREKLENTNKKVSKWLAGACLRIPISTDFLIVLVQKYKEQIHWKSNTQSRWNFFQEVDLGGKNTSKFSDVHCWMPNHGFSRSRQHVYGEPNMCSSVQLASAASVVDA